MYHYVEQYRDKDGQVTGRIDVSDEDALTRDRIELATAVRSWSGFKTRQVPCERPLPTFPPITNPTAATANHTTA